MTGQDVDPAGPDPARPPIPCPRCGATIAGDQSWCLECGLSARTRLAPSPGWRAPLVVAGAIGLAAIAALVVAFLVVTSDNAPLPTTAAAPPPTVTTVTAPVSTTATGPATGTVATTPAIPTTTTTTPTTTTTATP